MKLASLHNGKRDGELIVVSADLKQALRVPDIAGTLQEALDNWHHSSIQLKAYYEALNHGKCDGVFSFDPRKVHAPLPRAYQWADGSAYVNHVELVRKARGATMPENFWYDPLMYQGGSDSFLPPTADILMTDESYGIDFEAEVAIVVDDTPMGVLVDEALDHICLIMLVNDISLRNLIPAELAKGFGFFQSKPSSSFSPIALTPDELGANWHEAKVCLPLISTLNGHRFGAPNAGVDMTFNFADLIVHAAKTRSLSAGSIIGSGTVSNKGRSQGFSCIAEKRMLEILDKGEATTPFMHFGDVIRIEMLDELGNSLFGAIDQTVKPYRREDIE